MVELGWGETEGLKKWKRKFKKNDTEGREKRKKGEIERRDKGDERKEDDENKERVRGWNVVFWNVAGLRN